MGICEDLLFELGFVMLLPCFIKDKELLPVLIKLSNIRSLLTLDSLVELLFSWFLPCFNTVEKASHALIKYANVLTLDSLKELLFSWFLPCFNTVEKASHALLKFSNVGSLFSLDSLIALLLASFSDKIISEICEVLSLDGWNDSSVSLFRFSGLLLTSIVCSLSSFILAFCSFSKESPFNIGLSKNELESLLFRSTVVSQQWSETSSAPIPDVQLNKTFSSFSSIIFSSFESSTIKSGSSSTVVSQQWSETSSAPIPDVQLNKTFSSFSSIIFSSFESSTVKSGS